MTLQAAFVAGTTPIFSNGVTTLPATTPANVADDDHLYAFVYARSEITAPAGWTLVTSVDFANSAVPLQRLACYKKNTVTSANASTSFTWTQVTASRMGVTYALARHCQQVEFATEAFSSQNTDQITPDSLTATRDGELFLVAASSVLGGTTTPTPQTGATLWGSYPVAELRLAGCYQARNTGQSNSGAFDMDNASSPTDNGMGAIVIRLQPLGVMGEVLDADGNPAARTVRAYRRDTGAFLNSTTSNGTTGAYAIGVNHSGEVQVVCVDDDDGTLENDLILRTFPV